ncbi:MAG: hypothetical protein QOD07_2285 [Frankiaceae bacterium]|nr:hypothetical protein [Frankiaceae bacterium]
MRRTTLALTVLALATIAGCSSTPTGAPAVTVRETLGPREVALPATSHVSGHFEVRLLLGRCGITYLTGTHAEFEPNNPLCRVHERVTSTDASYHSFSTSRQRLILADGTQVAPSIDAMEIKRQPDSVTVGGRDVVELDVYFEPPTGSPPQTLRFYGDTDTGKSVTPPGPLSVDLPVPGLAAAH